MLADLLALSSAVRVERLYTRWSFNTVPQSDGQHSSEDGRRVAGLRCGALPQGHGYRSDAVH